MSVSFEPSDAADREAPAPRRAEKWRRRFRRRAHGAPSSERPGWLALTPALAIAVFVAAGVLSVDVGGDAPIVIALIAAVPLGALASYLCATYWPRAADETARTSPLPNGEQPAHLAADISPSTIEPGTRAED